MMLDTLGALTLGGAIAAVLTAIAGSLKNALLPRIAFGALAGIWIALVVLLTAGGYLRVFFTVPVMFAIPLLAAALLAVASPGFRATVGGISPRLIIGLNVIRSMGFWFLLLAAAGRLSGPFPYFAGIGDIITGLAALPVARLVIRTGVNDTRVLVWNAFGLLDLVVAVALGVTSFKGSSSAIGTLPWSLIPLVLVPAFMIGHLVVFAQARSRARQSSAAEILTPSTVS